MFKQLRSSVLVLRSQGGCASAIIALVRGPTRGGRRLFNQAVNSGNVPRNLEVEQTLYTGGFDRALRILKRVSVFSCVCTVFGVPLLAISSSNPRMTSVQKFSVAFVVVLFGVGTTLALHTVVKPYVTRIVQTPDKTLRVETMTVFGNPKSALLDLTKISPAKQAWATFELLGRPFFIEEAPGCYANQEFKDTLWSTIRTARRA